MTREEAMEEAGLQGFTVCALYKTGDAWQCFLQRSSEQGAVGVGRGKTDAQAIMTALRLPKIDDPPSTQQRPPRKLLPLDMDDIL